MTDVRRDAGLAGICGVVFLAVLRRTDATATLLDPGAVAVGVGGALVVEAVFVLDTPVDDAWERRWIRATGVAALVLGVAAVASRVGPVVVAAACWGLLTYFAVLGLALTGYWPGDADVADR